MANDKRLSPYDRWCAIDAILVIVALPIALLGDMLKAIFGDYYGAIFTSISVILASVFGFALIAILLLLFIVNIRKRKAPNSCNHNETASLSKDKEKA
jgi:hypothetical protein